MYIFTDLLKELVYSFMEAGTRFWNNQFQVKSNEEVEFLKLELERERAEKNKLLNYILELNAPKIEVESETEELQPIHTSKTPWHVTRTNLENQSRAAFKKMQEEQSPKTVAELEEALLGASNG